MSENPKVIDLIGGADADRTRDLLNAIQEYPNFCRYRPQPHETSLSA